MASVVGPAEAPATLALEGVSVELLMGHGWTKVVDDVGFTVGRGETVGLVGESGSGKSVTCLSITQLLPESISTISSGRILLEGRDLLRCSRSELEDVRGNEIGMIFQEPMTSLNPSYTIGDQIAEVVRRHRGASRRGAVARAVEMLDAVGIPAARSRLYSYPHELSGGMRQRVMIAIALACEPKLLIADEPTTALDVTVQAQVLDVLRTMSAQTGTSVLLITHDLGVVADLCDRVVVMYAGEVVEEAPVVPLFGRPGHPYTSALLGAMPLASSRSGKPLVIPGIAPHPGETVTGCRFRPRCSHAVERCAVTPVELAPIDEGRTSRCIRVGDLDDG